MSLDLSGLRSRRDDALRPARAAKQARRCLRLVRVNGRYKITEILIFSGKKEKILL